MKNILEGNLDKLHSMAEALIKYETIDGAQIDDIMHGQPPRPPKGSREDNRRIPPKGPLSNGHLRPGLSVTRSPHIDASGRAGEQAADVLGRSAVIRHVVQTALDAGLDPAGVVVGPDREAFRAALEGLPVRIVGNDDYEEGLASSIRAGVAAIVADVTPPYFCSVICP